MIPATSWRTTWLVLGLGLRRFFNRLGLQRRAGGTRRRRRVPLALLAVVGAVFVINGVHLSSAFVTNVAVATGQQMVVSPAVLLHLHMVIQPQSPSIRDMLLDDLEATLQREGANDPTAQAETLIKQWRAYGLNGFQVIEPLALVLLPEAGVLPPGPLGDPLRHTMAMMLALLAIGAGFVAIGSGNQDLGQVTWTKEWLFTLPVPAPGLMLAKGVEYAVINPFLWFIATPLMLAMGLAAGWGWWALPVALACALYLGLILGPLRLVSETWLRLNFGIVTLRHVQAGCTIAGMVAVFLLLWAGASHELPAVVPALGPSFTATWLPMCLPVELTGPHPGLALVAMLAIALAMPLAGAWTAAWLVRGGLITSGAAPAGRHRDQAMGVAMGGIIGKELRLLLRDRNLLVQVLAVPVMMFLLQLLLNPDLLPGMLDQRRHAATLAFGLGAYALMFSAMGVLAVEGRGVWLLFTLPRSLSRLLLTKTVLWAGVALLYALAVLTGAALAGRPAGLAGWVDAGLALLGIAMYAVIAAALGILGTDPLESEPRRRLGAGTIYIYLILTALYGWVIYGADAWQRCIFILLLGMLAVALWQRACARLPGLLDPADAPQPGVQLSDGLMAALIFFVLQALVLLMLGGIESPTGAQAVGSFAIAGAVVALAALLTLWRAGVPDVLGAVGLRPRAGAMAWPWALAWGVGAGLLAVLVAIAWLLVVDQVPVLKEAAERYAVQSGQPTGWWLVLAAVVLAPLVEEFIFRGLIFRGLRAAWPVWPAVVVSALVFAVVHDRPVGLPAIAAMGIAAALVAERSRWLLAPIACHATYNGVMVLVSWWVGKAE